MAIRLATIRAAGQFSLTVNRDDMAWGRDLAVLSADMLCDGVAKYMRVPLDFSEICAEIVARIRKRGGKMRLRDVLRSFEKHVKRGTDIHAALSHLVDSEQLEKVKEEPPHGGRPSIWYRLVED